MFDYASLILVQFLSDFGQISDEKFGHFAKNSLSKFMPAHELDWNNIGKM